MVIVTQGGDPTIVVMGDQVMTVKLPKFKDKTRIVDTNGAGDTFLSGVFLQMLLDDSLNAIFMDGDTELLKKAIEMGN